ncbi:AAA family ATPase [Pontibacter sp. G13]|uniref:AAA family ATPase n=1 Tax=Pontibacter sp. G13 TaxID=3074898 RepID=UPI00288A220B|nr:AAA family ATPase [Pontibacter sp. G13]WNJ18584.1 AAA family ATPase [Pontibacter sp. G13]
MGLTKIYVAATSQHVGKTTSTLGLVHVLRERGFNVGYCKPVGQQFIEVGKGSRADKDALLFADSMGFELVPELHSPVILGPGATTQYLDNPPQFNYGNRLLKASKILQQQHEVVVYEGTGHPGVGSVVNLSNAKVAEMLHTGVIMVVEAGIGNTIDKLDLNLSVFEQKNIPILGVILNKAIPSKIEKVRHYVGMVLEERGIELLGILPYEEELGLPVMHTIAREINGSVLVNEHCLNNKVKGIIAGSLIDMQSLSNFDNQLLVVSIKRLSEALKRIEKVSMRLDTDESPLSGIVVTGEGEMTPEQMEYFDTHQIPVLRVHIDTYEVVIKISRIEVKINTRTPWKVKKAVELFREHVNVDSIMEKLATAPEV